MQNNTRLPRNQSRMQRVSSAPWACLLQLQENVGDKSSEKGNFQNYLRKNQTKIQQNLRPELSQIYRGDTQLFKYYIIDLLFGPCSSFVGHSLTPACENIAGNVEVLNIFRSAIIDRTALRVKVSLISNRCVSDSDALLLGVTFFKTLQAPAYNALRARDKALSVYVSDYMHVYFSEGLAFSKTPSLRSDCERAALIFDVKVVCGAFYICRCNTQIALD